MFLRNTWPIFCDIYKFFIRRDYRWCWQKSCISLIEVWYILNIYFPTQMINFPYQFKSIRQQTILFGFDFINFSPWKKTNGKFKRRKKRMEFWKLSSTSFFIHPCQYATFPTFFFSFLFGKMIGEKKSHKKKQPKTEGITNNNNNNKIWQTFTNIIT